jgi:hypothetical protein
LNIRVAALRRSKQPGRITRLAGCTHDELKHRTNFWVMPTWVTESAVMVDGDSCAPPLALALRCLVHSVLRALRCHGWSMALF